MLEEANKMKAPEVRKCVSFVEDIFSICKEYSKENVGYDNLQKIMDRIFRFYYEFAKDLNEYVYGDEAVKKITKSKKDEFISDYQKKNKLSQKYHSKFINNNDKSSEDSIE